jgi:LPS-assembly protein
MAPCRPPLKRILQAALFCAGLAALSAPIASRAQTAQDLPTVLVADTLKIESRNRLIASGSVEIVQGERRLTALRVIYDRTTDKITLEGPLTLQDGTEVSVLADAGELDAALQNGLLTGARMVFDQQLQLAAQSLDRVGGRYTQLAQVAATSCRVCATDATPLWQIRARRVLHDQTERQLYFEDATLLVKDVPLLWVPRLRLPDPTLKRASGFLIPELRQNSTLGFGVVVPYFFKLGDHRDLTLRPYIATHTKTLEWRYRQAFTNGEINFDGAISRDDILPADTRLWLNGGGHFDLSGGWKLDFDIEATSDKAYPVEYSFNAKDRLDSELAVSRVTRDSYTRAGLIGYQTLRATENNSTMPTIVGDVRHEQRYFPALLGGEIRLATEYHSHYRYTDIDIVGRDINRLYTSAEWRHSALFGPGIVAASTIGLALDSIWLDQDTTAPDHTASAAPYGTLELRWPLMRQTATTTHIIEPMMLLGWAGGANSAIPNEESTHVEFDEGNLLSLSRFPAADRRERGRSLAYGVTWTRQDSLGWRSSLSFGQVLHAASQPDFSISSGLNGKNSDILFAGQIKHQSGIDFTLRSLIDPAKKGGSKAEARLAWLRPAYSLGASYVWLGADAAEARPVDISEWSLDGTWRMSQHWSAKTNWRYDVASDKTAEAGLGLIYRNECVEINLSASRRFTASTIVAPSTDFGFTVSLGGFSAKTRDASYTRTCH